jgi:flagellar biosynthetic protein FlhB
MAGTDDRTEAPTARRVQRAREEGDIAVSRELVTLAVLGGAMGLLALRWPAMGGALAGRLAVILADAGTMPLGQALGIAGNAAMRAVLPVAGVAAMMAVAATLGQTRFLITPGVLAPRLSRLDPRARLARLFGPAALAGALKSVAKFAVVAAAVWLGVRAAWPGFMAALGWTTPFLGDRLAATLVRLVFTALLAQAVIAAADVAFGQWRHLRRLRMTRQELRDEHRESEGDPMIKRRIRQIQQQRARRRMMAAVPTATVVLTNPTHYAVALAYERSREGAPRVVAKGADEVAARIREMAERHRVPVVSNPPLARALFRVELGAEIPAEHYRLVAEIIAYVWRLRGRVAAGTGAA